MHRLYRYEGPPDIAERVRADPPGLAVRSASGQLAGRSDQLAGRSTEVGSSVALAAGFAFGSEGGGRRQLFATFATFIAELTVLA